MICKYRNIWKDVLMIPHLQNYPALNSWTELSTENPS